MNVARAAARPAQFDRLSQHRRAMLAKINIGRQQLAIDEDDYRQALLDISGQISLKACSEPQLEKVLTWLKSKGFKALASKGAATHPMARKARAMWISLYQLGAVHNPSEHALEAFAKRQLGCERLVWARQSDANRLIEALKAMAIRAGWVQVDHNGQPFSSLGLQYNLCMAIHITLKRGGVVPDDWSLDDAAWKLCGIETARERAWSAEDYQRLAAALGKVLREHGAPVRGA